MNQILDRLPEGSRIAILRLRSLGDCILTTPAISLLKAARPDLQLAIIVEDPFTAVFEANPDVHRIMPPSTTEIALWRPELVLNLHGGTRSTQLTFASRARVRAGFAHFRFRAVYNVRIPRAQEILRVERKVHTAEHLASAMFYLGVPRTEIPRARLYETAPLPKPARPYAVIHPIASAPEKTWPAERFLDVAKRLKRDAGIDPVFIAGPEDNLAAFRKYRCVAGAPLSEVKSLIAQAAMFVGNDSGPAHMAAAFGLPTVVLFGPSDHEVWAPWKTDGVVLKSPDIAGISVEQVAQALTGLLV